MLVDKYLLGWFAGSSIGVFSKGTVYGHAHHLCRNMLAYAVTPVGDTLPLLKIDKWNFNWQLSYRFDRYLKVPKKSVVHFFASYDNSDAKSENLHHPPKDVYSSFMGDDKMLEFFILNLKYEPEDDKRGFYIEKRK